jgi:hypothetical protein
MRLRVTAVIPIPMCVKAVPTPRRPPVIKRRRAELVEALSGLVVRLSTAMIGSMWNTCARENEPEK